MSTSWNSAAATVCCSPAGKGKPRRTARRPPASKTHQGPERSDYAVSDLPPFRSLCVCVCVRGDFSRSFSVI